MTQRLTEVSYLALYDLPYVVPRYTQTKTAQRNAKLHALKEKPINQGEIISLLHLNVLKNLAKVAI